VIHIPDLFYPADFLNAVRVVIHRMVATPPGRRGVAIAVSARWSVLDVTQCGVACIQTNLKVGNREEKPDG